eukprot:TRINITY_DN66026_c0_g1_i1.p1 TRINITY_DN66026_c0_g1~~TRINITY_DN66026_c0_g1_i1.p1  ORF type:complete len:1099 (+),score=360.70 TRINITY_DN66026_c0_g1_i1:94-3297(+)
MWLPRRGSAHKYQVARGWEETVDTGTLQESNRPATARESGPCAAAAFTAAPDPPALPDTAPQKYSKGLPPPHKVPRRPLGSLVAGFSQPRVSSAPARGAVTRPPEPQQPLWVDVTLSQAQRRVSSAVADPQAAQRPCSATVCALLAQELRCASPAQQARCLEHFLVHIHALPRCQVDYPDATDLLTVLFIFMRRGSGVETALTPWLRDLQARTAELAFRAVCAVFRRPSRHTPVWVHALKELLADIDRDTAYWRRRTVLPGPPQWPPQSISADDDSSSDSDPERQARLAGQRSELERRALALQERRDRLVRPSTPPPKEAMPFLQTLDAVPQELLGPGSGAPRGPLGDLTEDRFKRICNDFFALDHDGGGTLDFCELGAGAGNAMVNGINIASHDFFLAVDTDRSGTIGLEELIMYWYPNVPRRFIRRRVKLCLQQRAAQRQQEAPQLPSPSPTSERSKDLAAVASLMSPKSPGSPGAGGRQHARTLGAGSPRSGDRRASRMAPPAGPSPAEEQQIEEEDTQYGVLLVCDDWRAALKMKEELELKRAREQMDLVADDDDPDEDETEEESGSPVVSPPPLGRRQPSTSEPRLDASVLTVSPQATTLGRRRSTDNRRPSNADRRASHAQGPDALRVAAVVNRAAGAATRMIEGVPSVATRRLPWGDEAATRLKDTFDVLDIDGSGEISFKEISMNGGQIGGRRITRELFFKMDRDRSGQVDLTEVCRALYPRENLQDIKVTVRRIENMHDQRVQARQELKERNEREYRIARDLVRQATREQLNALESEVVAIRRKLQDMAEQEEMRRQVKQRERALRRERRRQAEEQRAKALGPCVPLVHQCSNYPATHHSSGLRLRASDMCIDPFISSHDTRAAAAALLDTLDQHGIDTRAFTARSHILLPRRDADMCRVYRDFASLLQQPRAPRLYMDPAKHCRLRFVTNLRRHSNVMYRLQFEGHNATRYAKHRVVRRGAINTVACGSTGFTRWADSAASTYASLGNPFSENLAREAVANFGDGISKADLGYSSEGYVQVTLWAPSFCDTSISVSAWLTHHDAGADHPLAGRFILD